MTASKHMGQTFDRFLQEDGIYEEVQLIALKKTISQQIKMLMNKEHLNKTEMAQRLGTSRFSLDRLLNDESSNITLNTINKAALILGKRVDISLVDLHHQE
ncbi:MAG: helix-turn-helix transcriptional regulator [Desulfovermiculus sp.]|nr:helix-turn-helix transcriptional regulator [Desulfovermiculus sp.]